LSFPFRTRHAFICGSTDGIGKSTAIKMAELGCEITLIARDKSKLKRTIDQLSTLSEQNHKIVQADFNDPGSLKYEINNHVRILNRPIDILINNSGGPKAGPIIEASEDEFRLAFDRLLICNHIMAKAVVPNMKKNNFGRIINIISTSVKQVIPGLGVSNTIRGSVAQWGKTLALELGEFGICVNNVLPGYTSTARLDALAAKKAQDQNSNPKKIKIQWANNTSLNRLGTPDEIANVVTFLASDESSYVTGHNFSVDGGRYST
tara:strand:- start:329 stop:1117 length:789 start_codon:yes stop_codon:yes gene_type:complete